MISDLNFNRNVLVKLFDKHVPFFLIFNYISAIWETYYCDSKRTLAHDAIFEYINIDRYDITSQPYHEIIENIKNEAFSCCGKPVNYNNSCKKCDNILNLKQSISNVIYFLKNNKLFIIDNQ